MKRIPLILLTLCFVAGFLSAAAEPPKPDFIKWIDFKASKEMIQKAYNADINLRELGIMDIGTCEILAWVALKNGNRFSTSRDTANLNKLLKELRGGNRTEIDKYAGNKYFKYYKESYHAVLDGIIGEYSENGVKKYGLRGYFPLAAGHWYSDYDDFGNSRGYGFKRRHLGHDIFGSTGTPIIAVEGGTVTEWGWNQYGGWRIGIRSDDTKRYYYYAHLRRNTPYPEGVQLGSRVSAGQVIGYLGVTGYSRKANTNMKTTKPHLHFGMQIIFDPSQEDGNGEIWIDVYQICKFLAERRVKV